MVGLNCLEPNQRQSIHAHDGADKFYFVLAGQGSFTVGEEERNVDAGAVVIAPAGVPHGVVNSGAERLRSWSPSLRASNERNHQKLTANASQRSIFRPQS